MARDEPVTKTQLRAMQLLEDGMKKEKVAMICFDCVGEDGHTDKEKLSAALSQLRRWQRSPAARKARKDLIVESIEELLPKAVKMLGEQLDAENGWLVNKAINDALRYAGIGEKDDDKEDREIVVRLTGGPILGVPGETDVDEENVVDEAE